MYFIFQTEDQEVIKKPKLFYKKKKTEEKHKDRKQTKTTFLLMTPTS